VPDWQLSPASHALPPHAIRSHGPALSKAIPPPATGQHRTDLKHQPLDPVIVAGAWVAAAGAVYLGARSVARSLAHAGSDGQRPVR